MSSQLGMDFAKRLRWTTLITCGFPPTVPPDTGTFQLRSRSSPASINQETLSSQTRSPFDKTLRVRHERGVG